MIVEWKPDQNMFFVRLQNLIGKAEKVNFHRCTASQRLKVAMMSLEPHGHGNGTRREFCL